MKKARFASIHLSVIPHSENRKIGGAAATYRPIGDSGCGTCPSTCALKDICYAKKGRARFPEQRSHDAYGDLEEIAHACKNTVRHHVSGDVFFNDKLDTAYVRKLIDFHKAHPDILGWLYTHRISDWDAAGFTADSIPANLIVIASCDHEDDVQYAKLHGWKYALIVVSADSEEGQLREGEVYCPFDRAKDHGKLVDDINVTCTKCRLCLVQDWNVIFTAQFPGQKDQQDTQRARFAACRQLQPPHQHKH